MMIVTGSGQGLDMISKLLVNPGDTVLCEEFCYQGALNRFRKIGAKIEAMKLDADGIVIDALAAQLADAEGARASRRSSSTPSRPSRTRPPASCRWIAATRC